MTNRTVFDFDTPVERGGTASEKWAMYEKREVLPFWLADMDFQSPPAVMSALHARVEHGVFGYTSAPEELIRVVMNMLEVSYGWKVERDWLVWLPGLVVGINVTCRAFGEDGDEVLTTVPVYPPFLTAPGNWKRHLVTVPLTRAAERWEIDFDRLAAAITPRTRVFLLCSPHNPVGRAFSREELLRLAAICAEHDVVICSDEIHCDLILDRDKRHIPTATLSPEIADRTVTLMAPSKTFNLPGLGCSFAIISNARLRTRFREAMTGIVPYVNALAYTAAEAAYRHGAPWQAALLDYLRDNRDLVFRAVNEMPGLATSHVEATYLAWIDTREAELDHPAEFFEAAGVGLGNGVYFGGPGFVRLTFGCPQSMLLEGLERMRTALLSR